MADKGQLKEKPASQPMQKPMAKELSEAEKEEAEFEAIPEESLPFPKATIVNMMRQYLDQGKQIKGQVKVEMNKWLGKMVERVTKKMNALPYTYIDHSMFKDAIDTYEKIQDIEDERDRIIKYLEKIKSDCDLLEREVERKFEL